MKEKIAIIGSGVAGASAAYFLQERYDVTVFEKEKYFGGHVHTHDVIDEAGNSIKVDTGFVFFNKPRYPYLLSLLDELSVTYEKSQVSFGLQVTNSCLSANSWWQTVAQSIENKKEYERILEMFFDRVTDDLPTIDSEISLTEYVCQNLGLPIWFLEKVLLPLAAGAWSNDFLTMQSYQAKPILLFLDQHGFLGKNMLFDWLCIPGGYDQYISEIVRQSNVCFLKNTPVKSVTIDDDYVEVITDKDFHTFDRVIFACHADTALGLLSNPTALQKALLQKFHFHDNHGYLHTDTSAWKDKEKIPALILHTPDSTPACLTSHLNPLQNIESKTPYFFTLNPTIDISVDKIVKKITYRHTSITSAVYDVQAQFEDINTENRAHFIGAYWGKAYHEDGVESALRLSHILE